jgi:hypothetical protein
MFYLGLTQLADDSGCLEDSPFAFKINLYPSPVDADITTEVLAQWVAELEADGKIVAYEADGKRCLYLRNFHKHQTLENPSRPDVALPPWVMYEAYEKNPRAGKYIVSQGVLTEYLQNPDGSLTVPLHFPSNLIEPNLIEPNLIEPVVAPNGAKKPISTKEYSEDFERFWEAYPRKLEKRNAYAVWLTRLREKFPPGDLIAAAQNYGALCVREARKPTFIKHAATFLGPSAPFKEYVNGPPVEIAPCVYDVACASPRETPEEQAARLAQMVADADRQAEEVLARYDHSP